jgi:ADP-glucose pyrophosphorylase
MIPFAGRFRVADFTLRNAVACEAKRTVIVSNVLDDLSHYLHHHPRFRDDEKVQMKIILETKLSLAQCARHIFTKPTQLYILYRGDAPILIDFAPLLWKFKTKKKRGALLYLVNYDGKPSLSRSVLICDKKTLDDAFKRAMKEKHHSPHIFELIINQFIIKGVRREVVDAYCRPIENIPEYYHANFEALRDAQISEQIRNDPFLTSGISVRSYAFLGQHANVSASHIAEACELNGEVYNSIIFPGALIGERASVRNSIVLPFCRIAGGARIDRCVIDETTDRSQEKPVVNIPGDAIIGSGTSGLKNSDYPESLFDSISLVGKNCALPDGMRVGSASYISSGIGADAFTTTKTIDDGCSMVRQVEQYDSH